MRKLILHTNTQYTSMVYKTPRRVNSFNGHECVCVCMYVYVWDSSVCFIDTSCIWRERKLKNINLFLCEMDFYCLQHKHTHSKLLNWYSNRKDCIYGRHLLDYCRKISLAVEEEKQQQQPLFVASLLYFYLKFIACTFL